MFVYDKIDKDCESFVHVYNKTVAEDFEKELNVLKYKDKEIKGTIDYLCSWLSSNVYAKQYTIDLNDIEAFKDFGAEKLDGRITIYYNSNFEIELRVPSLRILENYSHYLNNWTSMALHGEPKPIWGEYRRGIYLQQQKITKRYSSIKGAIAGLIKLMDRAYILLQEGIDWSNTEQIQKQFEFELEIQKELEKYRQQISELQSKKYKIENQFNEYREKCFEGFKKTRETLKDFD